MSNKKYLPPANEFTPNVVDLIFCLDCIEKSSDDADFRNNVRNEYFLGHAKTRTDAEERKKQQLTLAGNVLIGLRGYKLVSEGDLALTETGKRILDNFSESQQILAVHLIEVLCGQELLLAMEDLASRSISRRNKAELANVLNSYGLRTKTGKPISQTTTDHTKFATWMQWCGLLNSSDEIDEKIFESYIGRPSGLVGKLWRLTDEQFLFLKFLWQRSNSSAETEFKVKELLSGARGEFGDFIKRSDHVAADILDPLEQEGFFSKIRTSTGRGGNSGSVEIKQALTALKATDFDQKNNAFSASVRVDRSLNDVIGDLNSSNTHTKGVALEQLAILMGQVLNLRFVGYRERSNNTGGAEVDVIFENVGKSYTRWLVQCKNTQLGLIHVSTIAKEVGNAVLANANVIMIITTGRFSHPAREFAEETVRKSNFSVLLLDGTDLEEFCSNGNAYLVRKVQQLNENIAEIRNS